MEVEPEIVLEEGEITDSENEVDTDYTPLQRPVNYAQSIPNPKFQQKVINSTDEEDQSSESNSDSDSDSCQTKAKKQKKLRPKLIPKPKFSRKRRNDIWSTRAQEDVLAETMISCDVSRIDRSRNVESYDYTLARRHNGGLKRTRDGRNDPRNRVGLRDMSDDEEEVKGAPRDIMDLTVTFSNGSSFSEEDMSEMARDIANKLSEEKDELIRRILTVVGFDRTLEHFKETQRIEKDGGMLIMNRTRRRTPGGVFFFLVKRDDKLTREQVDLIFNDDKLKTAKERKMQQKFKNKKDKAKTVAKGGAVETAKLPDLLTRAELHQRTRQERESKESDERDDVVPPPSPVTDHGVSNDGITDPRHINSYEDDYLDMGCGNDMDLF